MASRNHELDELTKNEIKLGLKRKEYFYGENEKQLEELRTAQNLPDDVYYEETSFGNYRFFNVVNEGSDGADNDRLLQYFPFSVVFHGPMCSFLIVFAKIQLIFEKCRILKKKRMLDCKIAYCIHFF